MFPVISIVGKSNSGKTTLLEKLIPELRQRGYNLAVIKHSASGFELDPPGKDSWRFTEAGSGTVVLNSERKIALIKTVDHEATLEEIIPLLGEGFDLVLTEGFIDGNIPKIEVHRKELGELLCTPEEIFALVTDEHLDIAVPQYSPGDIEAIADLIEKRASALDGAEEPLLLINGTTMLLNPFTKDFVRKTLLGMVSALNGAEEVRNLRISLRRGPD